jgi:predicted ATPase
LLPAGKHLAWRAKEPGRSPPSLYPIPSGCPPSRKLGRYEAIRLFCERAKATSSFELTEENAPAVAKLCRRLDGIPLAIELAAARTTVLSAAQILKRLEDSLKLLAGAERTAPTRQRTLRGTLDWSYELLGEQERKLFGRLCVFAGGWTLEGAEAVGAGEDIEEGEVLDLLSRLVDKSMVVVESGAEGALRYRMLEPVRQYAQELSWRKAGKLGRFANGTRGITWRWPSAPSKSGWAHNKRPGWSNLRPSTTTCGRLWGGRSKGERPSWDYGSAGHWESSGTYGGT